MQTALGRATRAPTAEVAFDDLDLSVSERVALAGVLASPGFRLTRTIQRSWCEGRAVKGASFTLALLAPDERSRLIAAWVDRGGGSNSFFFAEADAFLGFLSERLPDPSHALSLCRFERAVLRAAQVSSEFVAPDTRRIDTARRIATSADAALISFFADPGLLVAAARGGAALPPLAQRAQLVLIAPNLPELARSAQPAEESLWRALAAPISVTQLERLGHPREVVGHFLTIGAAEMV